MVTTQEHGVIPEGREIVVEIGYEQYKDKLKHADHGHIDTEPEEAISFADYPELLGMLRVPPAGERRAVYLHPRPGATLEVAAYARFTVKGGPV